MSANRSNIAWHLENQIPGTDRRAIGMVYEKLITLTAVQILLLYSAPVELVAAPGAGKVIEFLSAALFLDYSGTAFAAGGDLKIQTITGNVVVSDVSPASEFMNLSADAYEIIQALSDSTSVAVNDGLEITNATAVHTGGDTSTVKVSIMYRIHDFNEKHPRFDN